MAEIFHELAPRCIIAIIMGISSIIGSLVGATLVFAINEKLLEIILGIVLLIASICLYKKNHD